VNRPEWAISCFFWAFRKFEENLPLKVLGTISLSYHVYLTIFTVSWNLHKFVCLTT